MSISGLLLATVTAAAFQQYEIGMTLEEARQIPIASDSYGRIWLACSGDADAPSYLVVTDAERSLGITKCWPVQIIARNASRASLQIGGGVSATVEFIRRTSRRVRR